VTKTEELEGKIKKVAEVIGTLKRENHRLKTECDSLKSHVSMLSGENHKAQRAMADFELLRKKHDQVTHRVERALTTLNAMRPS
jgi:ATP/maltotriose-dependent transcriptional regulator MalT